MSNYVVIARFDEATDKKLNKLRKTFTNSGYSVPEWPVHITIGAYENIYVHQPSIVPMDAASFDFA